MSLNERILESLLKEGRNPEAFDRLRIALAEEQATHESLSRLGAIFKKAGCPAGVLEIRRTAVTRFPLSAVAHHNLAASLGDLGRGEEAIAAAENAFALGLDGPETWLVYARALQATQAFVPARAAYIETVRRDPSATSPRLELSRLIWLTTGDCDEALRPLQEPPGSVSDPALLLAKVKLLAATGAQSQARRLLEDALATAGETPSLLLALSQRSLEDGDIDEAWTYACRAVGQATAMASAHVQLAAVALARGRTHVALSSAERAIQLNRDDQAAWAYLATAARILGLPAYEALYDYDAFVYSWDLPSAAGWSNRDSFLGDLAQTLRRLNPFAVGMTEQTVRFGSQTLVNLAQSSEAVLVAFFEAVRAPINAYLTRIGAHPHPLSGRNTGRYRIDDAWSVRLGRHGHHVDHLHHKGWLSSAFYVETPAAALNGGAREGWIRFGRPPFETTPRLEAQHHVRPAPGRLVLFPSYMWHGTEPFTTNEERLTLAFDIVPA